MKLTKNAISRTTALLISPAYVAFIEGNHDKWEAVNADFEKLKRNQHVITFHDGQYYACTITSIKHDDMRAVDGPVVRLTNGEFSWRVDGDRYCAPV